MSDLRQAAQQALDFIVATNKSSQFWLVPESNLNKTVTALRAALAAAVAEPVSAGFKLVPLEPTPEMAKAGCYRYCAAFVKDYKAMLSAAPAAPPQREPYDQTALALCNACGWKAVGPDGCLNCAPRRERVPLTDEQIHKLEEDLWKLQWLDEEEREQNLQFARAIERAHGIKEQA